MFLKRSGKTFALFTLLLVAGCSSTGGVSNDVRNLFPSADDNPVKIESDPSGASVYVMGEKVGVTPLKISRKDVFPITYPKEKESLYGTVTLKKAGCSDFTKTVNSEITNVGLNAQLDCGGMKPASPLKSEDAPHGDETVEGRLNKIKDLLNKGLITEDEAKKARERVLNDL
ncbi:MAG: PEGA domain-containing protein [Gallionellaceae bacterium]